MPNDLRRHSRRANACIAAYKLISELSRRVERCVMRHYDLSNINASGILYSNDQTEFIDAQDPERMWVRTTRRVYGGDGIFFGEALMLWSYTFRRPKDW